MQLVPGCLVQGQQGGFQAFGVGQKSGAYQNRPGPQVDECGIDTVETGARHQTDVDLGRRGSRGTAHSSSARDRKSTRLNSSHTVISYAVFCLKKKKKKRKIDRITIEIKSKKVWA